MTFAVFAISLAVLILGGCLGPVWVPEVWKRLPFRSRTSLDFALEVVEASLQTEADAWVWDHYYAKKDAVAVWIANKDHGLHVELAGNRIDLSERWKLRLWKAVKPTLARIEDEKVKAISRSIVDNVIPIRRRRA